MFPTITKRPPSPPPKRYIREDIFTKQPKPAAVERYCKAIKTIRCESCGADINTGADVITCEYCSTSYQLTSKRRTPPGDE